MRKETLILILLLICAALMLSGCGSSSSSVSTAVNWPGLTADENTVYYASGNFVEAVENGKRLWQYPEEANGRLSFYAPVAFDDENVFAPTYSNQLHVLSKEDGTLIHTIEVGNSKNRIIASPILNDDTLIVLSSSGIVTAYSVGSMEQKWQTVLHGEVWVKPVSYDGKIYVASMDKKINVLDAETGGILESIEISGAIMGDPVLEDGKLYFATLAKEVVEMDTADNQMRTLLTTDGEIWAAPLVWNDKVVAGDMSGNLYCVELESGNSLWQINAVPDGNAGFIAIPTALDDDTLLVIAENGDIMLYDREGKSINTRSLGAVIESNPALLSDGTFVTAPQGSDAELKAYSPQLKEEWVYIRPDAKAEKAEKAEEDK